MAQGLEIFDENGVLSASSEFFGYYCRKSYQGVTTKDLPYGNSMASHLLVDVTGFALPIVAIHSGHAFGYCGNYGNSRFYACTGGPGSTAQVFIFDRASTMPSGGNVGLEAWKDDGSLAFSTTRYPMVATGQFQTPGGSISGPSGRYCAYAQMGYAGHLAYPSTINCYDSGSPEIWNGGYCGDLKYWNDSKIHGAYNTSANGMAAYTISYDDVLVTAGSSDSYYIPAAHDSSSAVLCIDVNGIPGGTFW